MRLDLHDLDFLSFGGAVPPRFRKALLFAVFGSVGAMVAALVGEIWIGATIDTAGGGEPAVVTLLIDHSAASGEHDRLAWEKVESKRLARYYAARNVVVGIVACGGNAEEVLAPTSDPAAVEQAVDALTPSGADATAAGLEAAGRQLASGKPPRMAVVIAGVAPADPGPAAKAAEALRGEGIAVVAVACADAKAGELAVLTGSPATCIDASAGPLGLAVDRTRGTSTARAFIAPNAQGGSALVLLIVSAVWAGLLSAGVAFALSVGVNLYLGRPAITLRNCTSALLLGFAIGAAAGGLAQLVNGLAGGGAWVVLGVLLGTGLAPLVSGFRRPGAVLGGMIGGMAGAVFIILLGAAVDSDQLNRLCAAFVGGFGIGLMIAVAETATSQAWLEVIWSAKDIRVVQLGPVPVRVGADRTACEVYIPKFTGPTLSYRFESGRIMLEDPAGGTATRLAPGDQRNAGNVILRVNGVTGPAASTSAQKSRAPSAATAPSKPTPVKAAAGAPARVTLQLASGGTVVLQAGAPLVGFALGLPEALAAAPIMEIVSNPADPSVLGIRNVSRIEWTVRKANAEVVQAGQGKVVRVEPKMQLRIESVVVKVV